MTYLFRSTTEAKAVARTLENDADDIGEVVQLGQNMVAELVSDTANMSMRHFLVALTALTRSSSARSSRLSKLICYAQKSDKVQSAL